jgi:hypothetical protein
MVTAQTFRDHADAGGYPAIRTGELSNSSFKGWLSGENENGMGVFFAVNETKPNQRSRRAITKVRAFYLDIDGLAEDYQKHIKVEELLTADIPPHAIIETRNGLHVLWNIVGFPVDSEAYKGIEKSLIHRFGGDPGAKDIARCLRLPGFFHVKDPANPFLVTVLFEDEGEVRAQELIEAYPLSKGFRSQGFRSERPARHAIVSQPPAVKYGAVKYEKKNGEGREESPQEAWERIVSDYATWPGTQGLRHETLLIALGNAIRLGIPQGKAESDLYPIVRGWRGDSRDASVEVRDAANYAYEEQTPYSSGALYIRLR